MRGIAGLQPISSRAERRARCIHRFEPFPALALEEAARTATFASVTVALPRAGGRRAKGLLHRTLGRV